MTWKDNKGNDYLKNSGLDPTFWRNVVVPFMKKKNNNTCEFCSSKKRLCVHHTDYEKQDINHLQLLCFNCHNKVHKEKK